MKLDLLIFALLALVVSQSNPPEQRNIQITANQQTLNVQAIYSNGSYQDSFTLLMTLSRSSMELLNGQFQYQNQNAENQSSSEFTFHAQSLLEINATETETYQGDPSVIIQEYPDGQTQIDWNNWVNESRWVDEVRLYSFSATTTDGHFTTRVHISVSDIDVNGVPIGPNDVKIDFEVHNFPYTDNKTRIVLKTEIRSQSQSYNSGDQAINQNNLVFESVGPNFPFGSFSWAPTVNASNKEVPVVAYSEQKQQASTFNIFFTFVTEFPPPRDIIWDPRIGLDYNAIPEGPYCFAGTSVCGVGAYFIIIGIIVAALLIVVIVLFLLFKRRSGYDNIDKPASYV